MIFRNLDGNKDWEFGAGKGSYVTQEKAVELNISTRILSWVGDCFFAQSAGIDWVNRLGSKSQQVLLDLDLRRCILQSFGVTALNKFEFSLSAARVFRGDYTISTIFKTTTDGGFVINNG